MDSLDSFHIVFKWIGEIDFWVILYRQVLFEILVVWKMEVVPSNDE